MGWKTNDMLAGLEGIMYAAGASGEDLAMVADIITDGLTAFGESADQSSRMADVLAAAASNSNTNIGMMGETFKYVAPVAGAMGYSMEDAALAIGLMANSGIKAGSAGTALRNILSNMANPTDKMAGSMERLGLSLTDDEGNMLSMRAVLDDLRSAFGGTGISVESFEGQLNELDSKLSDGTITEQEYEAALDGLIGSVENLTDAEKVREAATLAGKYGMSGLLAIVNASEEDYNKLADAIDNSAGAAQRMNEVRIDNLQGDITLLKSALEGLGIEFYESINTPMRDVVKTGTEMVNGLMAAFQQGGLSGLVGELGSMFAQVATSAAEQAPKLIDSANQMISSFLTGIQENLPQILTSGAAILESLISGIGQTLPQFSTIAVEAISSLAMALLNNAPLILQAGIDTLLALVNGISQSLPELIPVAVNAILELASTLLDNIDLLIDAAISLVTGLADGIIAALPILIEKAPEIVEKIVSAIIDNLEPLITAGLEIILALQNAIIQNLPQIAVAAGEILITIIDALANMPSKIAEILVSVASTFLDWAREMSDDAQQKGQEIRESIVTQLKELPQKIWDAIISARDRLTEWGNNIKEIARQKSIELISDVIVQLVTLPSKIYDAIKDAVERVATWGNNLITTAKNKISEMVDVVKSIASKTPTEIKNAIWDAINRVIEWGVELVKQGKKAMTDMISGIVDEAKSIPQKMGDIGKSIVEGVWLGIQGAAKTFYNNVKNFFSDIVDEVKDSLGINSPAKKMIPIGGFTVEGFVEGIYNAANLVDRAISDVFGIDNLLTPEFAISTSGYGANQSYALAGAAQTGNSVTVNQQIYANNMSEYELERYAYAMQERALWGG